MVCVITSSWYGKDSRNALIRLVEEEFSGVNEYLAVSAVVKGFGCRPQERRCRVFGDRRRKVSKGGNRA
jgi:hypothetical protein